jgi:DNA-binding transcriptional MerR regulator
VSTGTHNRLLSIGEFASATQLSPKALRLYDDQQLLPPAKIDPVSGYRYYRSDQVALGRLIRTLREMGLSLDDIGRVVSASGVQAELLLSQFAGELDQRYAREKRAFQTALLLLRDAVRSDTPAIEHRARPSAIAVVRTYSADRRHFYERLRREIDAAQRVIEREALRITWPIYSRLIDPLSTDEAQVELLLPIAQPTSIPREITLRQLPAAPCAAISTPNLSLQGQDLGAALDAIFDWFDRHGHRALDVPWLSHGSIGADAHVEVLWAYEPATTAKE